MGTVISVSLLLATGLSSCLGFHLAYQAGISSWEPPTFAAELRKSSKSNPESDIRPCHKLCQATLKRGCFNCHDSTGRPFQRPLSLESSLASQKRDLSNLSNLMPTFLGFVLNPCKSSTSDAQNARSSPPSDLHLPVRPSRKFSESASCRVWRHSTMPTSTECPFWLCFFGTAKSKPWLARGFKEKPKEHRSHFGGPRKEKEDTLTCLQGLSFGGKPRQPDPNGTD